MEENHYPFQIYQVDAIGIHKQLQKSKTIGVESGRQLATMILHPKRYQKIRVNYKDKTMPLQDREGLVISYSTGPGPRNILITVYDQYVVVPRGNLMEVSNGQSNKSKNSKDLKI
jgi:ribosome recycling factor